LYNHLCGVQSICKPAPRWIQNNVIALIVMTVNMAYRDFHGQMMYECRKHTSNMRYRVTNDCVTELMLKRSFLFV
jgi:hypothetical protein